MDITSSRVKWTLRSRKSVQSSTKCFTKSWHIVHMVHHQNYGELSIKESICYKHFNQCIFGQKRNPTMNRSIVEVRSIGQKDCTLELMQWHINFNSKLYQLKIKIRFRFQFQFFEVSVIGQKDSSFELIQWHFDLVRLSLCEAPTNHAFLDTWRYLLIFYISDLMSQKFLVRVLAIFLQDRKVFAGWPECSEYLEIIWIIKKRSR